MPSTPRIHTETITLPPSEIYAYAVVCRFIMLMSMPDHTRKGVLALEEKFRYISDHEFLFGKHKEKRKVCSCFNAKHFNGGKHLPECAFADENEGGREQ